MIPLRASETPTLSPPSFQRGTELDRGCGCIDLDPGSRLTVDSISKGFLDYRQSQTSSDSTWSALPQTRENEKMHLTKKRSPPEHFAHSLSLTVARTAFGNPPILPHKIKDFGVVRTTALGDSSHCCTPKIEGFPQISTLTAANPPQPFRAFF